jgi:choice-of-anchor B domain-containing protein
MVFVGPAGAHDMSGTTALSPEATPTAPDVSEATIADALGALSLGILDEHSESLTAMECEGGSAGPYPCEGVDLESFVPLPLMGVGSGNDIWGWEDPETGREYALMGTATGTGFIDVTDPKDPVVLGNLPTRGTPDFILWRDIKVNNDHAYIVSEISGSGLQVFDLTRLRDADGSGPPQIFTADASYDEFSFAHNIAINEDTDTAYVVGSDTCASSAEHGGLHMVDISEPLEPTFVGCAVIDDPPENNYVHDVECVIYEGPDSAYQGREICFGSNEDVVAIYDVTDRDNPELLSQTGYPTAAYTHQGWLTPDQRYFIFGDELDESTGTVPNTATYILDVTDLDNPPEPKVHLHDTAAIDHNLYIHGNHIYQSNYAAGLRILDYDDDSLAAGELNEIGFFDVVPHVDVAEFVGTWSNYRFDSGTTVVSTIENALSGMFVLRAHEQPQMEQPEPPATGPGNSGDKRQDQGRGKGPSKSRG